MNIFNEDQLIDIESNRTYRDGAIMTMKQIVSLLDESINDITEENSIDTRLGYCMAVNDFLDILHCMVDMDKYDNITISIIRNAIMDRKRRFLNE